MIALWLALTASAQDAERHQARFLAARTAEAERRFEDAVAACRDAIDAWEDGPRARTCRERVAWLEDRQDTDGDFDGWTELSRVRADFREIGPEAARERVQALRQRTDLAELVEVDAGIWLARDALDRGDAAGAERITADLVDRHHGALRAKAVGVHARALAALGRTEEALAVEDEIRIAPPGLRETAVEQALRETTERRIAGLAAATVGAFAAVGLPLARRAGARGRPWGLVPIGVAAVGAWAIAEAWSDGAGAAAPWMGLGFAAVHLVSGPALRHLEGAPRVGFSVLTALATAALAWLALWATDTLAWVR